MELLEPEAANVEPLALLRSWRAPPALGAEAPPDDVRLLEEPVAVRVRSVKVVGVDGTWRRDALVIGVLAVEDEAWESADSSSSATAAPVVLAVVVDGRETVVEGDFEVLRR